ncbi:MAG: hypothetical protein A2Y36_03440, partial [Treponema sp. GWA1_62_8]
SVSAILGISALAIGTSTVRKQVEATLSTQVRLGAQLVRQDIVSRLEILQELAVSARTSAMDWETQRASLAPDVETHGYLDFAIVSPDGVARYVLGNTEAKLGDRDYVIKALSGERAVSDVLISRVIGKPVVMYAVPITENGAVKGALIARRDGNDLSSLSNSMGFGASGYAYMINKAGVVVAHPDGELVMNQFAPIAASEKDASLVPLANAFRLMMTERTGLIGYRYEGMDIIAGFSPVEGTDLILVVAASEAEIHKGINSLSVFFILATLICIALGIVIALVIGKAISSPIAMASRILGEINQGDGDLTRKLTVRSKDELGALAFNFNSFVDGLNGIIGTIRKTASEIGEAGNDLSADMAETSASVIQIMSNIESVKNRVIDQSAGVTETLATVEQISRNLESFKNRIDDQAANVTEASASIEELVSSIRSVSATLERNAANIDELLEASSIGKDKISAVVNIIREIGIAAEGMLEASDIISGVASQTNLLSMNAAIEAAHAGDAGRGFAVVADEIRKLSENSSEQTQAISKVLNGIKASIDSAVGCSRDADASFDSMLARVRIVSDQESEIKNAMAEQSIGGSQVLEAIAGINQITSEIHGGSAEILAGSRNILDEMNRLAAITREINQSVAEMADGAKEIAASVTHVTALSVRNKDSAHDLESQVGRFKVAPAS